MTKNELMNGMYVKTRNGNIYVVMGDFITRNEGYCPLSCYNDDMTTSDSYIQHPLDIMEVFVSKDPTLSFNIKNMERIWERPNNLINVGDIFERYNDEKDRDRYYVYHINVYEDGRCSYDVINVFGKDLGDEIIDVFSEDEFRDWDYIGNDTSMATAFEIIIDNIKKANKNNQI